MTESMDSNGVAPKPKLAKSGKTIGSEYVQAFRTYLADAAALPRNEDGSLSISAIADVSGIPRQSFYKNPQLKSLLDEKRNTQLDSKILATAGAGESSGARAEGVTDKKARILERRVNHLEQQNAALVAESAELRRQLKALRIQMGREDMAIETGRRIPLPPDTHG